MEQSTRFCSLKETSSSLVEVSSLQASCGRECPAASTLLLVLHGGHKSLGPPVNLRWEIVLLRCKYRISTGLFSHLESIQHSDKFLICEIVELILSNTEGLIPSLIGSVVILHEVIVILPDSSSILLLSQVILLHILGLEVLPLLVELRPGVHQDLDTEQVQCLLYHLQHQNPH